MTDNEIIGNLKLHNGYGLIDQTLKLISRQKAEIERLTVNKNACALGMERLAEQLEQAKSEAIKEFAERLKEKFSENKYILPSVNISIDNLVKEMTEQ